MSISIAGRNILVLGASGWLGCELSYNLAYKCRANVVAFTRSREFSGGDLPDNTRVVKVDFDDVVGYRAALKGIVAERTIHGVVFNAWDMSKQSGFNNQLSGPWECEWHRNYECLMWFVQAMDVVLPTMQIDGGSVVAISSMYSLVTPDPDMYTDTNYRTPDAYGPMKAALNKYVQHLAVQWGKYDIRVNSLCVGPVPKPVVQLNSPEFFERLRQRTVLNRVGKPLDVAGPVTWLLSKEYSGFVTGQHIQVDGGWTLR